jgi:hypothetical protein
MPRRNAKPKTQQAEIVSFAGLKAKRDERRANFVCTLYTFDHRDEPIKAEDIVLCRLKDGGFRLAYVQSVTGVGADCVCDLLGCAVEEMEDVVGRVVTSISEVHANA